MPNPNPKLSATWLTDLMGLKMPDGPMYGVVLPGTLMQELWTIPQSMIPKGCRLADRYGIDESFRCEDMRFWEIARELRSHEQPAPPASPGFWDAWRWRRRTGGLVR